MGPRHQQFNVGGMACSFCAESIETAYRRTEGVEEVSVSLAHEEVLVQYDETRVSEVAVKDTLRNLGYTIRGPDKTKRYEEQQAELAVGNRRLMLAGWASLGTAALMGWMIVVLGQFESVSLAMDLAVFALAVGTVFGPGHYILVKAYHSIRRGILNQHVLLEAGAFAGLTGGILGLFFFPSFPTVHFFAVTVFITAYHILSEYTSLIVRTRASQAVQDLLDLQPDTARRVIDGAVEEVPVVDLDIGDRVRVKPGETVPVDGEVVTGESTVDESVATGEPFPKQKTEGDAVIGGSLNQIGTLLVEVTAIGEDAFLNRVAREVEAARAVKPGIIHLADRVLKYFVPGVLTIAVLAFAFWLVAPAAWGAGPNVQRGAFAALAVLVLGYPCALGMATPLALIRGGGKAANRGILMRSGAAFQVLPDVDYIALDKTGTITVGEPAVRDVVAFDCEPSEMVALAASAETFSAHPLAVAILTYAHERDIVYGDPAEFEAVPGRGVRATVNDAVVLVGKPGWLAQEGIDLESEEATIERLQHRGLTVSGVVRDGDLVGLIGIGDAVEDDVAATVQRMTAADITPVMLTGDNERTARAVADEVGIDQVLANVLPDQKREAIRRFQNAGHRVAMVGDGVNDAPALTQADIGIAIGAGTDIAIESADIVLLGDRLGGVMDAYQIGAESYKTTRQNLIAAFSFNGVGVAAATTGLVHPVFAMIAMVLSVTTVLVNSFAGQLIAGEGVNADFAVRPGTNGSEVPGDAITEEPGPS